MSRDKQGSKAGRRERQEPTPRSAPTVSVRIVGDSSRAVASLRDLQAGTLGLLTVPKLRALATERGVEFLSKDRKADLIAKIVAE